MRPILNVFVGLVKESPVLKADAIKYLMVFRNQVCISLLESAACNICYVSVHLINL